MQRPGLGDLPGRGAALGLASDLWHGERTPNLWTILWINPPFCKPVQGLKRNTRVTFLDSPSKCRSALTAKYGGVRSGFGLPRASVQTVRGVLHLGARNRAGSWDLERSGCRSTVPSSADSDRMCCLLLRVGQPCGAIETGPAHPGEDPRLSPLLNLCCCSRLFLLFLKERLNLWTTLWISWGHPVKFLVTELWIRTHATERGGWTRDQLACIGVSWPPVTGWIKTAVGRTITPEQKARFEERLPALEAAVR